VKETVPPALAGERLDRVVAMLAGISRARAGDLVDSGEVTVDGRCETHRSRRVDAGAVVEFRLPEAGDAAPVGDSDVPLAVVYEDTDIVVVDKPAGMVVHPGAGQADGTLVHGLLARYPEIASVGDPQRPGIVHRLDKGTSGLLLIARSPQAYNGLVSMLASHEIERRYRALVWGRMEVPSGAIDAPIGRSAQDRTRMAVTARGRPALTRYHVRNRFENPVVVTELECAPVTGRTHQIRVHLASIGHPIVGDARYGGSQARRRSGLDVHRPWLHAEYVALEHPVTRQRLSFESPLPQDLVAVLDQLG
jgi:23S rRNA pseudouridine1911/1915/1917 synthase